MCHLFLLVLIIFGSNNHWYVHNISIPYITYSQTTPIITFLLIYFHFYFFKISLVIYWGMPNIAPWLYDRQMHTNNDPNSNPMPVRHQPISLLYECRKIFEIPLDIPFQNPCTKWVNFLKNEIFPQPNLSLTNPWRRDSFFEYCFSDSQILGVSIWYIKLFIYFRTVRFRNRSHIENS